MEGKLIPIPESVLKVDEEQYQRAKAEGRKRVQEARYSRENLDAILEVVRRAESTREAMRESSN